MGNTITRVDALIQDTESFPIPPLLACAARLRRVVSPWIVEQGRSRQKTTKGRFLRLLLDSDTVVFTAEISHLDDIASARRLRRLCEQGAPLSLRKLALFDEARPEAPEFVACMKEWWPRSMSNLSDLEICSDGDTVALTPLIEAIGQLSSLRRLTLYFYQKVSLNHGYNGNEEDAERYSPLFKCLASLKSLEHLSLRAPGTELPVCLGPRMPRLLSLEVEDYTEDLIGLAKSLASFRNLRHLKLSVSSRAANRPNLTFLHRSVSESLSQHLHSFELQSRMSFGFDTPMASGAATVAAVEHPDDLKSLADCAELTRLKLTVYHLPQFAEVAESFSLLEELNLQGTDPQHFIDEQNSVHSAASIGLLPQTVTFGLNDLLHCAQRLRKLTLALHGYNLSVGDILALSSLDQLEQLYFHRVSMYHVAAKQTQVDEDKRVAKLLGQHVVEDVQLVAKHFMLFGGGGGQQQQRLPRLRSLRMQECTVSDVESLITSLSFLSALCALDLELVTQDNTSDTPGWASANKYPLSDADFFPSLTSLKVANRHSLGEPLLRCVSRAKQLRRVDLYNFASGALLCESVSPLAALVRMRSCNLEKWPSLIMADDAAQRFSSVIALDLSNNYELAPSRDEISDLARWCTSLLEIDLSSTNVEDVSPLKDSKSLRKACFYECRKLHTIAGIEQCPSLELLDLWLCSSVKDLGCLRASTSLRVIRAWAVGSGGEGLPLIVEKHNKTSKEISAASVAGLENIPSLIRLELDSGVREAVRPTWKKLGREHVLV